MSSMRSIESITLSRRWTKTSVCSNTSARSTFRRSRTRALQSLHLGTKMSKETPRQLPSAISWHLCMVDSLLTSRSSKHSYTRPIIVHAWAKSWISHRIVVVVISCARLFSGLRWCKRAGSVRHHSLWLTHHRETSVWTSLQVTIWTRQAPLSVERTLSSSITAVQLPSRTCQSSRQERCIWRSISASGMPNRMATKLRI